MAENDLAERVRQYGLLLNRNAEKIQEHIRNLSETNPSTWRSNDDRRIFYELRGQGAAYTVLIREFVEKFPELYQAKPKTE